MNYFSNNPFDYARSIASHLNSRVYIDYDPENLELPNTDNFKDNDIIVHINGVYVKKDNDWIRLLDNHGNFYISHNKPPSNIWFDKEPEETDTAPWLALLED